ncbi:MAG: RNA methyltransferase [Usitatibacter sp.]
MKTVASRDNAAFKSMARLVANASERKKRGLAILDGTHLLAAFLDAGGKPVEVMLSKAGLANPECAALVERSRPTPATLLADALFDSLSSVESPTGIIACVEVPASRAVPPDARMVLLLEDIQDPGNVGTLMRSAAAAGADHVLLSPSCAFAWSPKVLRAAMGAHFATNVVERADLAAWLGTFRGTSIALAGKARQSLYDLDLGGPVAVVVGNEGAGISPALQRATTARARIPMAGRMESLNAAAAGTVALFEASRQKDRR